MAVKYSVVRFIVLSIMVSVAVLACHQIVVPVANTVSIVDLGSLEENAATSNLGIINLWSSNYSLPQSNAPFSSPSTATYYPAPGYKFVRWEGYDLSIGDPYSQSTTIEALGQNAPVLTAIYQSEATAVGGISIPINKLELIAPYLALAGLIAAVSTVYVIKRRKD
jgi:hypothetical protein